MKYQLKLEENRERLTPACYRAEFQASVKRAYVQCIYSGSYAVVALKKRRVRIDATRLNWPAIEKFSPPNTSEHFAIHLDTNQQNISGVTDL